MRKFPTFHVDGWLGATLVLAAAGLAAAAFGVSRFLGEDFSRAVFFAESCIGLLLLFVLAVRFPVRLGGSGLRRVLRDVTFAVLALAIAFLANVAMYRHDLHLDLSREGNNTPPPQLLSVLRDLRSDIALTYFYNASDENALTAKALLSVASRANEHFRFRAVDLDRDPGSARAMGVHAYNTALLQASGRRVLVENTVDLTQIAFAMLRALKERVEVVCFVTGHGESFPEAPAHLHFSHVESLRGHNMPGAGDVLAGDPAGIERLQLAITTVGYAVRRIVPATLSRIPDDCAVVAEIGPRNPHAPGEAQLFSEYLARGGRMLLMIDPEFGIGQEFAVFLSKLGLVSDPAIVIDPLNHYATDEDKVAIPYYPPHAITNRVALTIFPDARPIRVTSQPVSGVTATVLATSSEDSYLRPVEQGSNEGPSGTSDGNSNRRHGRAVLAAALEGRWPEASGDAQKPFRLVVVGNSSFATNAYFSYVSNGDLVVGMFRWLAGDEGMPTAKPQSFSEDRIVLTQRQMRDVFVFIELALPLSVMLFGGIVWWKRR